MIQTSPDFKEAIIGSPRYMELFAVVDISDPDKVFNPVTASQQTPWSKADELHDYDFNPPPRLATLERNRWLLDGSFDLIPDNFQVDDHVGYTGAALSGDDGSFAEPQWISLSFSSVSILQAFSLFFSTDKVDGVPSDFTVEVFYNETAYFSKDVTGNTDTEIQFKDFTVYDPTSVKVTITKWSLPGRRVRMVEIILGLYERWNTNELASFNATLQGNFSCLSLPYGSVNLSLDNADRRFEPRRKGSLFQSIEERQGIDLYLGCETTNGMERVKLGVFYQAGDGWKTSDNSLAMKWYLVDIIGLLTSRTFLVPDTLPTTLGGWIGALAAQLGVNFKNLFHVDPDYDGLSVTANSKDDVSDKKCGDILRWACQASGTWPRAGAETGYLTVEPLWNEGNKVTLDNLKGYPVMKANESLAALIFKLADGNNTEYVVSGNSTSSEKTVTIINPFIHNSAQAIAAAKLILSQYGGNVIETTGRGDPSSEIGDVDTIWLDESNATTARRMMQTFTIQNGVLQGCASRLLQADGSYLFTEFAVITESGKWKAPANVKDNLLRVVIGQGGQGGSRGHDGYVGGSGFIPGSGVTAGYGEQGLNGVGGKVWFGTININPEQEFDVYLGQGGAASNTVGVAGAMGEESTFGVYTSANGQLYPNGYTDIANGQSFARTGVAVPLPGTGDGGKGGDGGEPGQGYWNQKFWTQGDVDSGHHPGASLNGKPVPSGTPGSTSIVGASKGWDFVVTKPPGPGKPGVAGATGFVMVTWDKAE